MVLIKQSYQVVDKPYLEVSKVWSMSHIVFYVIGGATGFAASYILRVLREEFGDNCILFPALDFTPEQKFVLEPTAANDPKINLGLTKWGSESLCDFCQYTPIMSMILATILTMFFLMCPRGGTRSTEFGIKRTWLIVIPAIIITGIFAVVIAAAANTMLDGLNAFCAGFAPVLNKTNCGPEIDQFLMNITEFKSSHPSYQLNYIPPIIIICVGSWALAFVSLLLRCCCVVDFKILLKEYHQVTKTKDPEVDFKETEVLLNPNNQISGTMSKLFSGASPSLLHIDYDPGEGTSDGVFYPSSV